MSAQIIRGNALNLPLADDSVDLVVTSPPYFGLRSYQDGGEHYEGQIGAEPTPAEFVDALIAATREMVRVVKPTGSIWVNLGDKYAGSGMGGNTSLANSETYLDQRAKGYHPCLDSAASDGSTEPESSATTNAGAGRASTSGRKKDLGPVKSKSLIGIPWRYALRCIDDLGLILRAEVIWSKPNGLPESVTDRVRRSHEQWFHFTLNPRYYSAVDEVREEYSPQTEAWRRLKSRRAGEVPDYTAHTDQVLGGGHTGLNDTTQGNPLGKLPGSVWTIPTEPLRVPDHLGIDHFAAFPTEFPRRIITGWSPRGVCVECGAGRRPVSERDPINPEFLRRNKHQHIRDDDEARGLSAKSLLRTGLQSGQTPPTRILGYVCDCPEPTAPTTPGIVLDPFGGTGTTALVADALGRHGISVDMSADYCRLAEWRTTDPKQRAKAARKPFTASAEQVDGQASLLELIEEASA